MILISGTTTYSGYFRLPYSMNLILDDLIYLKDEQGNIRSMDKGYIQEYNNDINQRGIKSNIWDIIGFFGGDLSVIKNGFYELYIFYLLPSNELVEYSTLINYFGNHSINNENSVYF